MRGGRTSRLAWLGGLGAWTLLALMNAAQLHYSLEFAQPVPWGLAFRRSFEEWYLWGAISVGIVFLARRFPLERERLGARIALHTAGSFAAAALFILLRAATIHGQTSIDGTVFQFGAVTRKLAVCCVHFYLLLYWLVLMVHQGWHYYQRARNRELQTAELQSKLTEARLQALQMQLNPHFLFNTLNTISALIHTRPEDADRMVVRLGDMLRLTLDRACDQEVPLDRELALLEKYLEIERIRFEDRLQIHYAIAPEVRSAAVPCLILQPVVENAIRHGIELRESGGQISVGARQLGSQLELRVTDNGPGLPDSAETPIREGIGLSNTRARLLHLYGTDQDLQLKSEPLGGLEVILRFPWKPMGNSTSGRPQLESANHALRTTGTCLQA